MKRIIVNVLMLFLIAACFGTYAQNNVTGRMETEIISPVSIIETEPLQFGRIINSGEGGEVIVSPDGRRVSTGNITFFSTDFFSSGKFLLLGSQGKVVNIDLPAEQQRVYSDVNSESLIVSGFVSNVSGFGMLPPAPDGSIVINVGATLQVGNWSAAQPGRYYGTYEIVFTYN